MLVWFCAKHRTKNIKHELEFENRIINSENGEDSSDRDKNNYMSNYESIVRLCINCRDRFEWIRDYSKCRCRVVLSMWKGGIVWFMGSWDRDFN